MAVETGKKKKKKNCCWSTDVASNQNFSNTLLTKITLERGIGINMDEVAQVPWKGHHLSWCMTQNSPREQHCYFQGKNWMTSMAVWAKMHPKEGF